MPNIIRLRGYNLNVIDDKNTKNTKDSMKNRLIVLELEYMPHGSLFNFICVTECGFDDSVARTYFHQLINAIHHCHKMNIIHRDVKLENLLLDSHFNLKLADFGLATQISPNSDNTAMLDEFNVGTKGYQAPEILECKLYNYACDIFSASIVLFIMLSGYIPFEEAKISDKVYSLIVNEKYLKFWKFHKKNYGFNCTGWIHKQAIDLISRMMIYDATKRIELSSIIQHPWYKNENKLDSARLSVIMRQKYQQNHCTKTRISRVHSPSNHSP